MTDQRFKIAVIHDVERTCERGPLRWAYATRSHCLQKYAPPDFTVDRYSDADTHHGGWDRIAAAGYQLLFVLDYALLQSYISHARKAGYSGIIVGAFNKDHRSRHREWKQSLTSGADWLIVNNVARYEHEGVQPRTCCITNGLDLDHWKVVTPFSERPEKAIWCGGTGPAKKKGYHEVLVPLQPLLEADGIECDFRPVGDITPEQVKTPDEQLAWYNSARYVICASETEGTPGYLFEAMACGCVPFTTWVGNVPEFFMTTSRFVIHDDKRNAETYATRIATERFGVDRWSAWLVKAIGLHCGYGPPASRADYFFQLFRRLIQDGADSVEPFNHWDIEAEDI